MRTVLIILLASLALGSAFWAYQENYRTRQAIRDMRALEAEIGRLQERGAMLRAEWAYLNRPDRLRALAALNFERLQLLPMSPDHFGRLEQIAYPPRPAMVSASGRNGTAIDTSGAMTPGLPPNAGGTPDQVTAPGPGAAIVPGARMRAVPGADRAMGQGAGGREAAGLPPPPPGMTPGNAAGSSAPASPPPSAPKPMTAREAPR